MHYGLLNNEGQHVAVCEPHEGTLLDLWCSDGLPAGAEDKRHVRGPAGVLSAALTSCCRASQALLPASKTECPL